MTGWRPTASLGRASALGALGLVLALAAGRPALAAFAVPLLLHAAWGITGKPLSGPRVQHHLDHRTLFEGQATTSRLELSAEGAEHVVRAMGQAAHVAVSPRSGAVQALLHGGRPRPAHDLDTGLPLHLGLRHWGLATLGEEKVAFTSEWCGFRWGPASLGHASLTVLPSRLPGSVLAPAPHPVGLVGAHRSRRIGSGVEMSGIRPFTVGDKLRRIHWRHSLRTGELHTIVSDAEEDAAVLLVVDATADHGCSGGVGDTESTLDVSVRAAAQIAEHHLRIGDRVGLRVVGGGSAVIPLSTGTRHSYRILGALARTRPAPVRRGELSRLVLRAPPGTVVLALTPLLDPHVADVAAFAARSGHDVVVVDTMPVRAEPVLDDPLEPPMADLVWRLRRLDRGPLIRALRRAGCPVVPWSGPGTLDLVLREMSHTRTRRPVVR